MTKRTILILLIISILYSCDNDLLNKFNHIKHIGDNNPQLAMRMLDSLELEARDGSESIRMNYDMLNIRLKHQNGIHATSDIKINELIRYFEFNGSEHDIQEAYYYAGCTYQDLHDTPRAIKNFLKSLEIANESGYTDTTMQHCTYRNLYDLYYNTIHNYRNALKIAKEELKFAQTAKTPSITPMMHMAQSYMAIDSISQASRYLDKVLLMLSASSGKRESKHLYALLYAYSKLGARQKADKCYTLLRSADNKLDNSPDYNALGTYFEYTGDMDKAIWCFHKTENTNCNDYTKLNAAKALFKIYSIKGDIDKANSCAARFINKFDSLAISRNQRNAASMDNEFQYHLDRSRMETAENWKSIYMRLAIMMAFLSLAIAFTVYVLHMRSKTAALRQQLALADELKDMKHKGIALKEELETKTALLHRQKEELRGNEQELHDTTAELDRHTADLHRMRQLLEQKKRQSETLINMLHKTEMSVKAEDVVLSIKEAAKGKRMLTSDDWQTLYTAVDNLHPDFKEAIVERLGTFSEQQMRVCYLMRIGFDNPQIKNVTDIPRTTIWRWTKAYAWIYGMA